MGGTPKRMEQFAYFVMNEIGYELQPGTILNDISKHSHRYAMFKVGPVLSVSVRILNIFGSSKFEFPSGLQRWPGEKVPKEEETGSAFFSKTLRVTFLVQGVPTSRTDAKSQSWEVAYSQIEGATSFWKLPDRTIFGLTQKTKITDECTCKFTQVYKCHFDWGKWEKRISPITKLSNWDGALTGAL